MTILYGTTADGQNLPVQVNESGQLVAQGLQGPPGPEGPEGPSGGSGGEETTGEFTPEFGSDDASGAMNINYLDQHGLWWRVGSLITVWIYLRANSIVATNPRGNLIVKGLPDEARMARTNMLTSLGPSSVGYLRLGELSLKSGVRPSLASDSRSFNFLVDTAPSLYDSLFEFAWLDQYGGSAMLSFSFQGLALGSVTTKEITLDELV